MKCLQQNASSSSCKVMTSFEQLERKKSRKYNSGFFFEYRGLLKFDDSVSSLDQGAPRSQEQNETYPYEDKDEEPETGMETYLIGGGKILVVQINGSRWGDSSPDLVVLVTSKTSFKENVAPYLGIVIKCSMQGNSPSEMGLSSVELYLPKSFVSVQRSTGICFWEELFNMTVYDRTTVSPTGLSWPVCNPAFADHQQGLIAANGEQHIDPELLPIRVIDIHATVSSHGGICFYKPTNWSFHTISHTWSLSVRALSTAVGKVVSNAHELYDKVFEDANFLNDNPIFFDDPTVREEAPKCYTRLIAFFRLLQGEGVKAVWFDALCINQLKEDEKEREIARMGGYYAYNRGCYVLSHGVGMGSTLWALNEEKVELPPAAGKCTLLEDHYRERESRPALPRWFHRVWTLQEFILPPKLTFIVSGLARLTIGRVNRLIRQGDGPSCLCMCTLPVRDPQFRYWDRGGHLRNAIEEEVILGSEQREVCKRCGHVPFIRKSDEEGVYFVDREAYCFLCQVDLGPAKHWVQHSMQMHPEFVLWILTAVAFARQGEKAMTQATTVSMLRGRQCSTQEDRVLGVLGLLRDAKLGKFQLRTGQSLRSQLWQLHKLVGPRGLLKLCLIDVSGHPEMGMSWVPAGLINDKQLPGVSSFNFSLKGDLNMRILYSSMVLRVFDEGAVQGLFLVASILSGDLVPGGQVMPCKRVNPRCNRLSKQYDLELAKVEHILLEGDDQLGGIDLNGENICVECVYHSQSCKHLIRHCKLMVHTSEGETLTFPLAAHEGGCGNRSTVRISNAATSKKGPAGGDVSVEVDFRMVLTGVATVSSLKPFSVHLIHLVTTAENVFGLVCIRRNDDKEEFHKIGTFTCPLHLNFYPMSNRSCLIGGFGNDVSKYVCS